MPDETKKSVLGMLLSCVACTCDMAGLVMTDQFKNLYKMIIFLVSFVKLGNCIDRFSSTMSINRTSVGEDP